MPAPSVSNPLIRLTKMFSSLVCFRSVPGLEESPVLGSSRLVASTIMLLALLSGVAMHQVHAQNNAPIFNWQGEVQVSTSTLTIREGETLSYNIRLSEQPAADGWWVRIHVNGVVYYAGNHDNSEGIGIRWVPSVGWEFNQDRDPVDNPGPTQWRNVHITAFQDDDDKDEFVTITHEVWDEKSNCPPSLHGVAPVEVQVTDDETASTGVALSVNPMTVSEGAGGTTVTVRAALNGAARLGSTPVKVAVGKAGDSATEGTDYETVDDLTVTIPEGLTSATERFTLTPTDDVVVESDKTVTVSGTAAASGITTVNPATLTITDDDVPPDTIELRVSPDSVAENAGATGIMVTAAFPQGSAILSTPTVVNVTLAAATAQTADFTPVQPFNLTIPASARSGTATFQFTPNDDTSMEGSETVTVSGTTSGITTINPATLTIIDDDAPPDTIELSVSPDSVAENAGETDIMVTAAFPQGSATLSSPTVVNVTLAAATAQTADFTPVQPFNVTIPASAGSGTATFQFTPNDDTSMEGSETVTVSGTTTVSGITTISPATLTITDDDTPNNPPTGQPRITGTPQVGQTLTAVTTDIQDADGLGDFVYQWKADGTNIAGAMDSSYRLTNNEVGKRITVTVSFTDGIGTEEAVTSQPTAAVRDAVTLPRQALTVAFDPASYSTTEGGDPVTVKVSLNRASDRDITIPITVMPQGETEADDYTVSGLTDGTLSFAPGDLSKTFMIAANEDTDSDDETIGLGFGTLPEGVSQGETATATLTITDDDVQPALTVAFDLASYSTTEGGDPVTVRVSLNRTSNQDLTIPITLMPQGATEADDYTVSGLTDGTLSFASGDRSKTFMIGANEDTDSDDETIELGFGTLPEGVSKGETATATLTITDDDVPPALTVAFDLASYSTTEGGDPVTLKVMLNRTSDQDLTIPITLMPQGATEADDYTVSGLTDGTLNFAPGDLSKTFMIVANEDTDSDDETIELGFGKLPEGVSKGETATATLTIVDADLPELAVSFARAEHTIAEGGDPASINVNISPAADRRVEVPLVVTPQGGATSQDYGGVPASIVFEVGATVVTFQVTAPADQEDDPGESIVLGFGDLPEAVSEGDPSETTVKFTQQRSAEQFSASLKILLAVTARSVGDSAQTAIQSRFQHKRQLMRNRLSARGPNTGGSLSAGQTGSNGSGLSRAGALNHMPEADRFGFAPPRLAEGAGPSMGSIRPGSLHNSLAPDYGIAPTQAAYGHVTLQRTSTADTTLVARQFSGIRARQPIFSQASFNLQMGESTRGNDGSGSVALWVQGDLQNFNGNITRGGMDYRGVMGAAHVGLDFYNSEQMLVGLSFMRSFARINYNADGVHGMFRNGMNTAHPYLYWQPNERFSTWVIGGLGRGEVNVNEPRRAHDLASDFRMFSGGMRSVLAKRGNTEVGVVLDSFTARLGTKAWKDIENVSGQASRTRMMLEMVHDKPLEAERSLSIKAELGYRHDAGDADRGSGAEAGFRLGYLDAAGGLGIASHGRMLLVRESDYRDLGLGMQVSWDSGEKRRGLQLSMMSSRGNDGGGRTTLWNNSALVTRPMGSGYMSNASQTSTSSEVAYGMDIFGGRGLLTPYSRLQLAGYGRDLRVGTEFSLLSRGLPAQPAKFQLEWIRRETPNRMIDLGMMLGISIPF